FTCASPNDFDVRELGKILERGGQDPALLLALMLGEEQWGRLEAVEAVFTTRHLNALVKAWLAHYGLDLGTSGGSAGHERRRQSHSKQASSGTTSFACRTSRSGSRGGGSGSSHRTCRRTVPTLLPSPTVSPSGG